MHGLLIGHDDRVLAWANLAFNLYPMSVNRALGVIGEDGTLRGAIFLRNFNGVNVELGYYGPNTLSVGIVRSIARIVIAEFNAARLTVVTSKRNKQLVKSLTRLGFKPEGVNRCYYGHKDTVKNTAVRLVAFRSDVERVAKFNAPSEEVRSAFRSATGLQPASYQ